MTGYERTSVADTSHHGNIGGIAILVTSSQRNIQVRAVELHRDFMSEVLGTGSTL